MAIADEKQQQIDELVAAIGEGLSSRSPDEIGRLLGKRDRFLKECSAAATKHSQPDPEKLSHDLIHIPFTAGRRHYVACGFVESGEGAVSTTVMLERISEIPDTRPIGEEDWENLKANRDDFDQYPELKQPGYILLTERRSPHFPVTLKHIRMARHYGLEYIRWCAKRAYWYLKGEGNFSGFQRNDYVWYPSEMPAIGNVGGETLVVRHRRT